LVVRHDTLEVARESFRVSLGRLSRGETGWSLATTIRYDRARPVIVLAPILEVNGDTMPVMLQYDVADPRQPSRVLGQLGRGRFTVRYVTRESERAREFSIGKHVVVLDDSVFALYLIAGWLATTQPTVLTAILPRSLRRETVEVQDHGVTATTLNRNPAQLRHVLVTREGGQAVHIWLDTAGRLMKVEIPSQRLSAERLAGG
jgi:predicted secreted protein